MPPVDTWLGNEVLYRMPRNPATNGVRAFGRLAWSEPQGAGNGGWTEYAYTPASGSIKPNVIVRRRANGSKTATVLAVNMLGDGLRDALDPRRRSL